MFDSKYKYDVFLSYAGEDQEKAKKIFEKLESKGKKTWFDQDIIGSSTKFISSDIVEGLEKSRLILFLCSQKSCIMKERPKEWPRTEVLTFFEAYISSKGRRCLSVAIEKDCCPKERICLIRNNKYIDLSDDEKFNNNFDQLLKAIGFSKKVFLIPPIEDIEQKSIEQYKSIKSVVSVCLSELIDFELVSPSGEELLQKDFSQILDLIDKSYIILTHMTKNDSALSYILATSKALNKPVIIILNYLDNQVIPNYLREGFFIWFNKDNIGGDEKIKTKIKEELKTIEKKIEKKIEDNKDSRNIKHNQIIKFIMKKQPEYYTPEQISKIEQLASEIWICTNTLKKDVEDGNIKEAVLYNLNEGRKIYTYFLPDTDEVNINIKQFRDIHDKSFKEGRLFIVPLANESYRLFEEIAIYFFKLPSGKEKIEAYTVLSLNEIDVIYLKIQDNIKDNLLKALRVLKAFYAKFFFNK